MPHSKLVRFCYETALKIFFGYMVELANMLTNGFDENHKIKPKLNPTTAELYDMSWLPL